MANKQTESSVKAGGSSDELITKGPSANSLESAPGKPDEKTEVPKEEKIDLSTYVPKTQYEALETKLGEQGTELGDYRQWFTKMSPLLDKLQDQPELVQAIIDGKLDSKLAEAVLADKVKIEDAETVVEAHKEVKKELGEKKYTETSSEDIERLIEEKVKVQLAKTEATLRATLKGNISKIEDDREWENKTNEFIKKTSDFADYANGVVKWLNDHPEQYDIEIAYHAVKGMDLTKKSQKELEEKNAEEQKNLASNAGGGYSQGGKIVEGEDIVNQLIRNRHNPNVL